jgi:hypothetical protein
MISAQGIVQDIRAGFSDSQLQEKYRVRPDALHYLMRRLVDAGVMTDLELYTRKSLSESDFMMAFSAPEEGVLRCPVCGNKMPQEDGPCAHCESLAEEFMDTLIIEQSLEFPPRSAMPLGLKAGNEPEQTGQSFIIACQQGRQDLAKQLLSQGVDINFADTSGMTPLMGAALEGREDIVAFLLANGADVNAKDRAGQTSLDHAASKGYIQIMRLLLEKGAHLPTVVFPGSEGIESEQPTYVPADPFIATLSPPDAVEVVTHIPIDVDNHKASR